MLISSSSRTFVPIYVEKLDDALFYALLRVIMDLGELNVQQMQPTCNLVVTLEKTDHNGYWERVLQNYGFPGLNTVVPFLSTQMYNDVQHLLWRCGKCLVGIYRPCTARCCAAGYLKKPSSYYGKRGKSPVRCTLVSAKKLLQPA